MTSAKPAPKSNGKAKRDQIKKKGKTTPSKTKKAVRSKKNTKSVVKGKSNVDTRRTIIIAHRGGDYGPENSMINFRGAVKDQIEGIEFDVWLSKDNVLMVMHGGRDGDLGLYGLPDDRVFDWPCK